MTAAGTAISARKLADAAASAVGIDIRAASAAELVPFLESIWGAGRVGDPSLLHAIAHAGNSVLIAERSGEPIGAALGVLGWTGGVHLHSHMVAVAPQLRGAGIGFAIKLAQRAQCLENDVTEMRWTYDPLIRRNAHFNLVKLGATVVAYHPDFYGTLDDAINGTDVTDRFEVSWRLDEPVGRPRSAGAAGFVLPDDFEAFRRDRPAAARELRRASAAAFGTLPVALAADGYVFP